MGDSGQLSATAISSMVMYSLSSASMLLVNKLCLKALPMPGFVSTAQFVFSAASIVLIKVSGAAPVDDFEWRKVRPYLLYVMQFVAGIYTNMKALQHSTVDTVIVFRAACPLAVCVLEWAFLGRQLPNLRSTLALLAIVAGVLGYVSADKHFGAEGLAAYSWVIAYTVVTATQMAYGKYIVGPDMKFASMWGPTQYTNVLSIVPMLITGFVGTAAGCNCPPPRFDGSAPPASLDRLQAQAAPTHRPGRSLSSMGACGGPSGAPPAKVGASGRPKVGAAPAVNLQATSCLSWSTPSGARAPWRCCSPRASSASPSRSPAGTAAPR